MIISVEEEELVSEDSSKQRRIEETEYAIKKLLAVTSKRKGLFSTAEDIQDTDEELAKKSKIVEQAQERQSGSMIRYEFYDHIRTILKENKGRYKFIYIKKDSEFSSETFHQEKTTKEPKELSEEDLKNMLEIVLVEEVGNITEAYQGFEDMLKAFDREDLDTLWSLVKEKFRSAEPTEDMEKALLVELKRLYEPDKEDALWKLQRYMHDPLTWRLYGSCAIHHVFSTRGHCIYMLPEKDYPLTTEVMMLMLSRSLQVEKDGPFEGLTDWYPSQVMANPIILISSDSSEDSVGSHVPRVILFGAIPAVIPVILVVPAEVPIVPADPLVAPEVGAVPVTSPTGVLDLVDYSSSDSDPSKDSLPPASELSLRDRVASRPSSPSGSSSHDTFAPSSKFPIALVIASPGIHRRPAILIRLGEAIPFGRPYRTYPSGSYSSSSGSSLDSLSNTSSGSPSDSLSDTSAVHSSGCDASDQTNSLPSTRVASSRLVYPPVMTLRYSEAFRR
ncbi:hypothetical protein Tco_1247017 [Tanacetum coccineum]